MIDLYGSEDFWRARCGKSARRDPCGGCWATGSPTAIKAWQRWELHQGSQGWYGGWTSFAEIVLGKWSSISNDDAFIQSVFTVQIWFSPHFRIQTANQNISVEVCFSCRKNYQNGKVCCDEAPSKISLQRCVWKLLILRREYQILSQCWLQFVGWGLFTIPNISYCKIYS